MPPTHTSTNGTSLNIDHFNFDSTTSTFITNDHTWIGQVSSGSDDSHTHSTTETDSTITYDSNSYIWRKWREWSVIKQAKDPATNDTIFTLTNQNRDGSQTIKQVRVANESIWLGWNHTQEAQRNAINELMEHAHEEVLIRRQHTREEEARRIEEERQRQEATQFRIKLLNDNRKEAEGKAIVLLGDLIGEKQAEIYEKSKRLLVQGKAYQYLLGKGKVRRINQKKKTYDRICIHLTERNAYPETDNVIALKLMIDQDEDAFNVMANFHGTEPLKQLPEHARA